MSHAAPNEYIHPAGTPVIYRSYPTGEPLPWIGPGTVTGTWMTQDEPGEQPYRVYSIDLVGGGNTVWAHDCTHYDFDWRERPVPTVCGHCGAPWFGLRDVECRPICAECGDSVHIRPRAVHALSVQ